MGQAGSHKGCAKECLGSCLLSTCWMYYASPRAVAEETGFINLLAPYSLTQIEKLNQAGQESRASSRFLTYRFLTFGTRYEKAPGSMGPGKCWFGCLDQIIWTKGSCRGLAVGLKLSSSLALPHQLFRASAGHGRHRRRDQFAGSFL